LIGDGFKKPDSLILAIPAFTFISTLPGLLYFDLAYDTQRYLWIEVLLCLLPPSGIAILLRLCFSNEAIGISVGWMHRAPVSNTPALLFMGMLLFDAFLWLSLSAWQIDLRERMPRVKGNDTSNWFLNRFKCSCNLFGWPIPQNRYCEVGDNVDHQQYEKNDCAIEVLHLRKFYNSGSDSICVLDNINAQLSWRQITVLLGSNGAGKTTFMKILSGLDTDYGGAVKLANCGSGKKRWIGWCPQSDSLYPFLTVNEHLEFFESLMECTTARISSYSIQDRIQIALQNLAMVEHRFTPAHLLSGGMKRRLSLALAFVGNPTILLLDEPTSGCDSWTRELVRRDILSRKTTSCIVVSTHHSDDVEVLADNIWFLNERHLVLNKPVEHLFSDREELRLAGISHRPVKFSTSTLFIKSQFVRFFGEALSLALQPVGMIHDNPPYSWIIPPSFSEKLISFVKYLDNLQEHDWTLEHYTVFSAISSYYGNQEVDGDSDRQRSRISSDVKFPKLKWIQSFMIIVRIRWIDLRKHLRSFFLSHLILPFMVAYFLALGCRDISYPKVKITSDNFHSMGEVPISMGHRNNDFDQSKLYSVVPQASWKGILNSDQLWNKLYEEYYQHTQNRWGAMVLNDVSPDWLETSLLINQGSMALPPAEVIDALGRFCNSSISYQRFCGAIVIELENKTHHNQVPDIFNDAQIGVILKSHQGLTTNFTLMSNVTSDHAAPVFVKEILSLLASLVRHNVSTSTEPLSGAPQYDLYSFPLPESNVVNKRYLERGFLGSTLATMYLLMTIVSCVKFVTKLNGSRMKRQLHSHGVSPVEYWLGHWIFDVCKVLWAVFAIFGGIYCGGNPIANFFFFSPALYGSVAIVGSLLFSLAIVSSSFTMVIFWEDILGSQLFILLTTISNGIFIKMYLDRRHSPTYEILINLCILISPAFSFTTIMFDIFKAYARCAMKGLLRQHDQIEIVYDMFARTRYCCGVLIIQAMVYLVICIMLDYYQFQLLYFIKSIRWKFSAQWMCSDIRNMLQESESFPTIHKLSVSSPSSCGGYGSIAGPLQDLTVSAGSRMREHLTFHPDYRVGLFPFLTRSTFKVAANKIKDDVPPISDDNDGDIEMRPLLSPISSRVLFPTEDTVECRDLCVDGNGSDSDLKLSLCNVSFKVPPSSRTAIMSMNGGGKTTLFDVLTGARSPVHGTAKICGKDVVANQFEIGKLSLVGYVPQEDSLLDFLTVRETLQLFSDLSRNFGEREHFVDSPDFLPRKYDQYPVCALSGGTKKKLSLAVANMHNPRLLLLDECTTGVDPISATSIIDYLHRNLRTFQSHQTFSQGLLFASHRVDEAFALCDEVLMLVNGQVFLQCPSLAFVELVHRYYQVDVYVCVDACADNVRDVQESFLGRLFECIGGKTSVERIVIYGQVLIRLTFRKSQVSVTKLWNKLDMWRYHGLISKYLFRSMEMEEILATILVASKVEHT
jgi:ABC-type multidrug transport system ATPase subunit